MPESDQQLIDRFRSSGQQDCLEELLRRHLATVRGLVMRMVLNDEVADDLTQDVFLRVVRGLERFEGRSEFSTWLFRIAMNVVRSYFAKQKRSDVQSNDEFLELTTTGSTGSPACAVLQSELVTEIQMAIATLSPQLRAAIVLVCVEGVPTKEAAEIENCSTDTMYWRVHEARRQLKKLLAEHIS